MNDNSYALLLIILTLISVFIFFIMYKQEEWNVRLIEKSIDGLDCIVDGKRIVGKDAKAIAWKRVSTDDDGHAIVQLCETSRGQFFEHRFRLKYGLIKNQSAKLLSQDEAKTWLSYDAKAYESVFGPPEVV